MRINCIAVEFLADQHLLAEWVEILMLPNYIRRAINSKSGLILSDSPDYILNKGHARFFYDKLNYVENRYSSIQKELIKRNYNTNPTLNLTEFQKELFNSWSPTEKDQKVNLERILSRINKKPKWYKLYNQPVEDWYEYYSKSTNFDLSDLQIQYE